MTEIFDLLDLGTTVDLIRLLNQRGIHKYPAFPPLIDLNTQGWWECTTLGDAYPVRICIWHKGKQAVFNFEKGILKSVETSAQVMVKI